MRASIVSLVVLAALANAARADDESFAVKSSRFVAKGKSVKVNEKSVYDTVVKIADDAGKEVAQTKTKKTLLRVYVEKTLATDKDSRTKFSREYEKAKDVEGDDAESKPYHRRTVVFSGAEGKYKAAAEGKPELAKDDLDELTEEVNKETEKSEDVFFPKDKVKVGGTWELDGKGIAAFFDDLKMAPGSVKGEGKLTKAYEKDGKTWGVVDLTLAFDAELGEVKKAAGTMRITLEQPLDGSSVAGKGVIRMTLAGKQEIDEDCKKLVADVSLTASIVVEAAEGP